MFMAIETRIDITFTVNWLNQYLSKSREIHMQAAKHIFCYLANITNLGILYRTIRNLIIFADTVYVNTWKFKSITDFCILISNGSVIWTSQYQSVTAQLTIKSEYIALADAVKQTV